ncbi:winged helix-turn-helix transcriptional regulator [Kineosporia sp. NBRC 101731]|uniref:winged helix-turn-helix transcriptional regulator n=1 Tax=Kineosporia sp. NBRC 101731 TaxID=3032199 RepID=UPI0024A30173|nr:winged helix-turn-helix transcriptional regulator [Kineosporia sp. NBRC 101731]GLY30386.1 HxlR family transcriptional regulator [Kineosporia sp. NBRC 101731]
MATAPDKRMYGQFCGLAAALDVIGERWTLLIVRELLLGPARFNQLAENLPGLGPNLLSSRLQTLANEGLVDSAPVEGDGRGKVYQLTALGAGLRQPVLALARWGLQRLDDDIAVSGYTRAAWGFLAVEAMVAAGPRPTVDETYEFRVDDEAFHIEVRDGKAVTGRGAGPDPAIICSTDAGTFIRIGAGLLSPFEAVVTGRLNLQGDFEAIERCTRLMGLATDG